MAKGSRKPGPVCCSRCEQESVARGINVRCGSRPAGSVGRELANHPCSSLLGTCEFYKCLSDRTPGDRLAGYYWNYGYKYCNRFNNSSLMQDPKAARWLHCVTRNLQRRLLSECVQLGSNLERIKACAYATHAKVYTNCGICELDKTFVTQLKVLFTPDTDDLWTRMGVKQMFEALGHCIARPFYFQMAFLDRFTYFGDLKEDKLAKELVKHAQVSSAEGYKVILGVMELLSNTADDDDVALEFMKLLSDADIDKFSKSADGRAILFTMKSALESGVTFSDEKEQIQRIGDKAKL